MAGYIGSKASVVSSGAERKKVITATAGQTAFTGLTYSPNRVHVFQNGVRLVDGTDYTATDGNSLTLTVGAATDDQVVVVSYNTFQTSDTVSASAGGTFTGDVNFTGAFTSQGIDDNATSTAMTLDGSGNLLVGTTSSDPSAPSINTAGTAFGASGYISITRDGATPVIINRKSSDGKIADFRKDGTTVGSIGTDYDAGVYVGGGTSALFYNQATAGLIQPYSVTGGAVSDGVVQLGEATSRFKDLYLSGGVYLGGTGSSNKLTDYEQGVWSPFWSNASGGAIFTASPTVNMADYTKIGNLVVASCYFNMPSSFGSTGSYSAGNDLHVGGLPFVANFDGNASYYDATVSWWNSWTGFTGSSVKGHTRNGSNRVVLFRPDGNGITQIPMSSVFSGASAIILTVTYRTTS